ncbi:dUTP diphosphatase [Alkalihalophilus lindianensis]|uniref:dUTP diphosphatase n=1 Tax=Alkalihalophilus lindianensis TaxID=1630542 RepID=A0ABU3XAA3_9BACI|nr:dUTP diphosphatase [Alkalihalophilus lindianensis]MDV2684818.1 dUTP diphosphatase [Alkalihalophilus lindianensis]
MNLKKLFETQEQLNDRILSEHKLENHDLFAEKQLAFLVELSELANETRCFKYWSKKGPSSKSTILEEYVDGLHFVLTLGLSLGYTTFGQSKNSSKERTLTEQFLYVMECNHLLNEKQTEASFHELAQSFLTLGSLLGFGEDEIEQAYFKKNEVNHQRQDQGY